MNAAGAHPTGGDTIPTQMGLDYTKTVAEHGTGNKTEFDIWAYILLQTYAMHPICPNDDL